MLGLNGWMGHRLNGGTFNLKFGRDRQRVQSEVERLVVKHSLDFLCTQEAKDYDAQLRRIDGYDYYTKAVDGSAPDNGILVRHGHKVTGVRYRSFGDGWVTVAGGRHRPIMVPRLTIDGWLRVRSVHAATPSKWDDGLWLPAERLDDYLDMMRSVRRFMKRRGARLVAGDWNEPPNTRGRWSPGWLAQQAGARCAAPDQKAGHGRIDWAMYKGCRITRISKDLQITEASDHEPVVFTVVD